MGERRMSNSVLDVVNLRNLWDVQDEYMDMWGEGASGERSRLEIEFRESLPYGW